MFLKSYKTKVLYEIIKNSFITKIRNYNEIKQAKLIITNTNCKKLNDIILILSLPNFYNQ